MSRRLALPFDDPLVGNTSVAEHLLSEGKEDDGSIDMYQAHP